MIMRVVYVKYMKPLSYLLSPTAQAIYEILYPRHDLNASLHSYFHPTSNQRNYVLFFF